MKKENDPHPVRVSLRDWSKIHKADAHVVAEKTEQIPSLSFLSTNMLSCMLTRKKIRL